MRRILQTAIGHPASVVTVAEFEVDEPLRDEVLVNLKVAPIHVADLLRLSGRYPETPMLPAVPGIEGVGFVVAFGTDVTDLAVGDAVLVLADGTWQEFLLVQRRQVIKLKVEIDLLQAAMLGVAPLTALALLTTFTTLKVGDWVIQNAANGAVGRLVVRLAAKRGVRTVNLIRRDAALGGLVELGADVVIVGEEDVARRVRVGTGGAPLKLALDAVGGSAGGALLNTLTAGGTLVAYGMLSGEPLQLAPTTMIYGHVKVKGFSYQRTLEKMPSQQLEATVDAIAQMVQRDDLHTTIAATYTLDEVQLAIDHAGLDYRDGKILFAF